MRRWQLEDGLRRGTITPEEGLELLRTGQVELPTQVRAKDVMTRKEWDQWADSGTLIFDELEQLGASEEMIAAYDHELANQTRIQYPGVLDD